MTFLSFLPFWSGGLAPSTGTQSSREKGVCFTLLCLWLPDFDEQMWEVLHLAREWKIMPLTTLSDFVLKRNFWYWVPNFQFAGEVQRGEAARPGMQQITGRNRPRMQVCWLLLSGSLQSTMLLHFSYNRIQRHYGKGFTAKVYFNTRILFLFIVST